jgi:hypothetical protein
MSFPPFVAPRLTPLFQTTLKNIQGDLIEGQQQVHNMGTRHYIFPLAFAMNTFSLTGFMVILGLSGKPSVAADFGIVQGATMALFYAFSANARNLILNPSSKTSVRLLLISRLALIVPLGAASFFLGVNLGGAYWPLALILIMRRITEWIAELHLSEMEFREGRSFAKVFFLIHSVLLVFAIWWSMAVDAYPLLGTAFWAILPMALHVPFILRAFASDKNNGEKWVHIYPHFGSTAISGVTVYVFRLLLLLLVGKALAGDLYTAYAIGGFVGAAYLNALGPTLAHHEGIDGRILFPNWLKLLLFCLLIAGVTLFLATEGGAEGSAPFGKSLFFWSATGLSMIGGSLVVLALRIRIRLIQLAGDRDVFGPDLIINLLIVAVVPFGFHLLGKEVLKTLYLYNAFIAFAFYYSAQGDLISRVRERFAGVPESLFKWVIGIILVFPLFFQLSGQIFNDPAYIFDSKGLLDILPIPISLIACFGGLFLIGAYERSKLGIYLVFLTFLFMLGTTIISSKGHDINEQSKLILLIQFILPFFGLILGQMYEDKKSNPLVFEKAAAFVLLLIVPVQLVSTYLADSPLLYPHLYLFSVYQHFQYVSTIFVCLYILALFSLWEEKIYKMVLIFLGPLLGIYAVISLSILTVFSLMIGLLAFFLFVWLKKSDKLAIVLVLLIACTSASTFYFWRGNPYFLAKYAYLTGDKPASWRNNPDYAQTYSLLIPETTQLAEDMDETMPNFSYRIMMWRFHIKGIADDFEKLLFGHARRPTREEAPSAHNYYLDLAYNFGLIATIPIFGLLIFTIRKLIRYRGKVISNGALLGPVLVTLILLLIDNSFKVGLRQPYPGIITFFIWGLFLSRLPITQNKMG